MWERWDRVRASLSMQIGDNVRFAVSALFWLYTKKKTDRQKLCASFWFLFNQRNLRVSYIEYERALWTLWQRWKYAFHTKYRYMERNRQKPWTLRCFFFQFKYQQNHSMNRKATWTKANQITNNLEIYCIQVWYFRQMHSPEVEKLCCLKMKCVSLLGFFFRFSYSIKHLSSSRERKMLAILVTGIPEWNRTTCIQLSDANSNIQTTQILLSLTLFY